MAAARYETLGSLITMAGIALGKSQGQMGDLLGVSRRTISRWVSGGGAYAPHHAAVLAKALYPVDPELAGHAATRGRQTLVGLGLGPSSGATHSPRLARIVLWAAADALDASPRAVRPAIVAALRVAREEGATLEAVEQSLEAMTPPVVKDKRG